MKNRITPINSAYATQRNKKMSDQSILIINNSITDEKGKIENSNFHFFASDYF